MRRGGDDEGSMKRERVDDLWFMEALKMRLGSCNGESYGKWDFMMVKRCIAMWMKAMCSEWNAGSGKIRYSVVVKQEHENGRINPHGGATVFFQTPCT